MAVYSPVLTYTFRDTLGNSDPNKIIKGAYLDGEFNAIHTASLDAASLAGNNSFAGTNTFATTTAVTGDVTATGSFKASGGTFPGVSASVAQLLSGSNVAAMYLIDASQGADGKFWPVFTSSGNFGIGATNDADTVTRIAFAATRTGNAISAVSLGNTTDKPPITLNGPVTIPAPASGFTLSLASSTSGALGVTSTLAGGVRNFFQNTNAGTGSYCELVQQNDANKVISTAISSSTFTGALMGSGPTGKCAAIYTDTTYPIVIAPGGTAAFVATTSQTLQGFGPVAAGLVDMTPDSGTGTVQCTVGMTTTPSVTATFRRVGKMAYLEIPGITGVSSGTTPLTFTIAFPTGFSPVTGSYAYPCYVTDNSSPVSGAIAFSVGGISMFKTPIANFSGTCGFNLRIVIPYPVA